MQHHQPLKELIDDLAGRAGDAPRVSLYMPTAPQPERMKENEIRLKDHLGTLSKRLDALDTPKREAEALLGSLEKAAEAWRDDARLERGLGMFAVAEKTRQHTLPWPVRSGVFAGERFHLKPLLAALERDRPFYVLALSRNHAGFFEGDARGLRRVTRDGAWPESLVQVAGAEPAGKTLHYHAGARGGEAPVYHGHGAGKDDVESELARFLDAVDDALNELPLADDAPVLLAGVADLVAAFRRRSRCARLAEAQVEGNVEHLGEDELHRRAWPLLQDALEGERRDAVERLRTGDPAVPVARQLPDVLRAAVEGRVDTLLVAGDTERWGRMGDAGRELARHQDWQAGDEDLLDRAAVESHRNGGEVLVVPADSLPEPDAVLARLRY